MAVYIYWFSGAVLKCPGRPDISFTANALLTDTGAVLTTDTGATLYA